MPMIDEKNQKKKKEYKITPLIYQEINWINFKMHYKATYVMVQRNNEIKLEFMFSHEWLGTSFLSSFEGKEASNRIRKYSYFFFQHSK